MLSPGPVRSPRRITDSWRTARRGNQRSSNGSTGWGTRSGRKEVRAFSRTCASLPLGGDLPWGVRDDFFPVWSPDGATLAFSTGSPSGGPHLYEASLNGGEPRELTPVGTVQWVQDWSGDGRFLCYSASSLETGQDIWILDRSDHLKTTPFLATAFDEIEPQFSPDGRWIAYSCNESGTYEVYVV